MADLQEALAARERRSRFTAIAISAVIILIVGFIVFRIANGGDGEQDVANEEQTTQQTEVADSGETGSGVDLDELFGVEPSENVAEESESDPVATESDTPQTEADSSADTSRTIASTNDDLPNTGPAENAAIAVVLLTIMFTLYSQNKAKLAEARLK